MTRLDRDNLKLWAFNIKENKVFYFDENGIIRSIPCDEVKNHPEIKGLLTRYNGTYFIDSWAVDYKRFGGFKDHIRRMAFARLKEGDTVSDVEHYLNTLHPKPPREKVWEELDRFICRIYRPEFHRLPENLNNKTFDFITVEVSVLSEEALPNRELYLKKNINEIIGQIVEKIENSASFKKYGIPSNFLRVTEVTLHRKMNLMNVQFELKKISKEAE